MRISSVETLHADGGYRTCSYVKIQTDEGLVGWSEYYDSFSGAKIEPLIHSFGAMVRGMDPREYGAISEKLIATTRLAQGGVNHQAIAAIENACLDIAGKAAGLPVATLLGGKFRDRMRVYWTHCGTYRARHADFYASLGHQTVRTVEDFEAIGAEARQAGFTAVKTNPIFFDGPKPYMQNPGFRIAPGFMDRSISAENIRQIRRQLDTLRQGTGPDIDILLDVNFSQRTEGALRLARALEDFGLYWLEVDLRDPQGLATVRSGSRTPIASMEGLHGVPDYRPYIVGGSADNVLVDVLWNGVYQSVKVANLADAFETHVAPHNPVGELGNWMSLHFCAAIPNARIMEIRPDEAPWTRDFVTRPMEIRDGYVYLTDAPGWGADVNEDALKEHPVK